MYYSISQRCLEDIITFVMLSNCTIRMQFKGDLHLEMPDILLF